MRVIIGIFLVFLLSACPNNNRRQGWSDNQIFPVANNLNTQNNFSAGNNVCGRNGWGGVTCVTGNNRDRGFRDFLSGTMNVYKEDGDILGDISCQPSNTEGVLVQLNIEVDGVFDPNGQNVGLPVRPSSFIKFKIIDRDIPGAEKPSPDIDIPNIPATRGTIDGNNITIHFADSKGTLDLEGTYDNNTVRGTISFTNNRYWDGQTPGAEGVLGNFEIKTCLAFRNQ